MITRDILWLRSKWSYQNISPRTSSLKTLTTTIGLLFLCLLEFTIIIHILKDVYQAGVMMLLAQIHENSYSANSDIICFHYININDWLEP